MADQPWTDLGTPGDVTAVQATASAVSGAADVAALTYAGELWWRRVSGAGWSWTLAGSPPAVDGVPAATAVAPLGPGADGAPTAAVGGGAEMNLWVHRPAADPAWTELVGSMSNGGFLRPLRLERKAGEDRSVLLTSDGQPWLATLADPADPAAADVLAPAPDLPPDWSTTGPVVYAGGSTEPAGSAQPHVVAAVTLNDTGESGVRVGFPDGAAWSWVDPGPLPDGVSPDVVDAVGLRAADGTREVCAVFPALTEDGPAFLLRGAGHRWGWTDLGRPGPAPFWPHCVGGVNTGAGEEPWVVAQTADDEWYARTSTSAGWGWLPGVPAAGYAWPGGAATAGGMAPWLVGLSGGRLWTWAPEAGGTDHGTPASLAAVVGTLPADDGADHHFVVDDSGRLWERGTFPMWIPHGTPAAGVAVRAAAGTAVSFGPAGRFPSVFVVGGDEHLWERRADPAWRWVDHGSPVVGRVRATLAPVVLRVQGVARCEVLVVSADGHLWARVVDGAPRWEDRGLPPGRLIFGVVGADVVFRPGAGDDTMTVAAAIGEDGHVWGWAGTTGWVDLGMPSGGDRAVAGIGARAVLRPSAWALQAAVLGSPGGRVGSVVWDPGAAVAVEPWQDLGAPPVPRLRAALGLAPVPAFDGARAVVVGGDNAVWAAPAVPGGGTPAWTRWGQPPGPAVARGLLALSDTTPGTVAVVAGTDGHLWTLPDPA